MASRFHSIPFSVLDLAVILDGGTIAESYANSLELAQAAEQFGYERYWFAEHHNMASIASSAPAVLIGHIAGGTSSIRVGSGGVMLPNHAPLIIAEQFGTLESLYPGRIDLGLGRAPGSDQHTARALRRDDRAAFQFPQTVKELQQYLSADNANSSVRAVPGEGLDIPLWILGSSTDSAHLAAAMGLPYAFASHFAPAQLHQALSIYRAKFQASATLKKPYAMACVNVILSDTSEQAHLMATSLQKVFLGIVTNNRKPLQRPDPDFHMSPEIANVMQQFLAYSFIGSKEHVEPKLIEFVDATGVDELMVTSHIYDHKDRMASYRMLSELQKVEA